MSSDSTNDDTLTLHLSLSSSQSTPRIPIEISKTKTTLSELRALVSSKSKIPLSNLKLIYRGRLMQQPQQQADTECVTSIYLLENDCVLHCIGKPDVSAMSSDVSSTGVGDTVSGSMGSTMTAAATTALPAVAASGGNGLTSAMALLKTCPDPKTAINTMLKIISNITSHPMEEKYRTIKSTNAAFQRKLGGIPGGKGCMTAMGFELVGEEYKLNATPEAWTKLVQSKGTFERELNLLSHQPTAPTQQPIPSPFPSSTPSASATSSMMQNLLSNPQMLQSAMQNNPMMNQYLSPQQQQMLNNPAMMQQLRQYMSQNPQMMQEMQRMMESGGGVPGAGDMQRTMQDMMMRNQTGMQPPPQQQANAPQQQQQANTSQQQQGEDSVTEEEMIAEAIARSLRET